VVHLQPTIKKDQNECRPYRQYGCGMSKWFTYNLQRNKIHFSSVASKRETECGLHSALQNVPNISHVSTRQAQSNLLSARLNEPNVSQVVSARHRDAVHLHPAKQSEPNVSQVVSRGTEARFTYLLQGASRTLARSSQRGTEMRFTYRLQGRASRTSARWSQ